MNYGHWISDVDFDPKDYIGFVYILTMGDGRKYIGAKKFWKTLKRPPSSYSRAPKKPFVESDWRAYRSSSKYIKQTNEVIDEFRIVGCYDSWGKTLYAECMLQIALDAVRSDEFLNMQCGGNFTAACFDEIIHEDVARIVSEFNSEGTLMYKLGHRTVCVPDSDVGAYRANGWNEGVKPDIKKVERPKQQSKPFTIVNKETKEKIIVENQNEVATKLGIDVGQLSRLRTGHLLRIGDWS